jgi:hypothetical protein
MTQSGAFDQNGVELAVEDQDADALYQNIPLDTVGRIVAG